MKKLVLVCLFFLIALGIKAQTVKLQPITINPFQLFNIGRYSYGTQSFANPAKLQVPILSLGDENATKYYKRFQTYNTIGTICVVAATIPAYVRLFQGSQVSEVWKSDNTQIAALGVMVTGIAFHIVGRNQLRKSIKSYNEALSNRLDMSFSNPTPSPTGMGLTFTYSLSK